jgi:hypothetical protein
MALVMAFDIDSVCERSKTCLAISRCEDVKEMVGCFKAMRKAMKEGGSIRPVENLPLHGQDRSACEGKKKK